MKRNKLFLLLMIFVLLTAGGWYWLYLGDKPDNIKIYPSKVVMCTRFAQSYLRTIQKTYGVTDFGSEEWDIAIDIETDFYNLCMLDLTDEALKNYKSTIIEQYRK